MNPIASHPSDGTVQWCPACGYCRPRWWGDEADRVVDGKAYLCPCGTQMRVRKASEIDSRHEALDSGSNASRGKNASVSGHCTSDTDGGRLLES
jgi:C1A family cysteine protease